MLFLEVKEIELYILYVRHSKINSIRFTKKTLAVCGNKCDLFDKEAVPEEHLKLFSNRIEGVFQLTSFFTGTGINDLFNKVAVLYLQKTNGIIKPKPLPSPQPKPIKNNKCCK